MNIESLFDFKVIGDREVAPGLRQNAPSCLGLYILDERGEPVAEPYLLNWAQWFEAATRKGYRRLADDSIGPYRVSTIFLGLDHGFGGGAPVLWETMIFGMEEEIELFGKRERHRKVVDMFRYTSKAEAVDGHARAVKLAQSLPQPV